MKAPDAHGEYLSKKEFPLWVSVEAFSKDEVDTLHRYGCWMQALADGKIEAVTDAQRQFLAVCQGSRAPITPHERAWRKFQQCERDAMNAGADAHAEIAQFVLDELDHFATRYRPPDWQGETEFLSPQHYAAVAASRTAQLALSTEPFIGYAYTSKPGEKMRLLICRHYTPLSVTPRHSDTLYASYLSPMGQIITINAGGRYGYWCLHEKAQFRPVCDETERWDAVDCRIDARALNRLIRSLRTFLKGETQAPQRRELRYTVQLPAQAVLDAVQDEIFRLPMNSFVRISGGPGTGKTTVLIKRLSQKTKIEFLTDEEKRLLKTSGVADGKQWLFFSPSDLLKSYLKEALAKELLPASDEHVKVYSTFRREVLRDSRFIRVGNRGYFRMPADKKFSLLKSESHRSVSELARGFTTFLNERWATIARDAFLQFHDCARIPVDMLFGEAQSILEANERLNAALKQVRAVTNFQYKSLSALPAILARSAEMSRLASELVPPATGLSQFSNIPPLIESLQKAAKDTADSMSLSRLFAAIPPAFHKYRTRPENASRFYGEKSLSALKDRMISETELDILLLEALRFVHSLPQLPVRGATGIPTDLQALLGSLRLIVMIDEATDFSPLELACMELIALPRYGGVTLSGDLMQRVTERGLRTWDDMSQVCRDYVGKNLTTGYRQTARLFSIAKALCDHSTGSDNGFRSAYELRDSDPPAIAFKSEAAGPIEEWLTDRICEIFDLSNNHLPTTAILVPTPRDVEMLCAKLRPRIHQNGLELDASHTGQALGDAARVRVFPVECIKGLEFEAVFYVGLDRMEDIYKDLLDKYVYVGLSRSRSFLGVTYETRFPQRLEVIAKYFVHGGTWGASSEHRQAE